MIEVLCGVFDERDALECEILVGVGDVDYISLGELEFLLELFLFFQVETVNEALVEYEVVVIAAFYVGGGLLL